MAMVDEFLDELTDDYTALYKENAALKAKLKVLVEKVEEYRATEDSMRATLLTAQKMADSIVREAEAKRDEISGPGGEQRPGEDRPAAAGAGRGPGAAAPGPEELAEFIASSRDLCAKELQFLEQLPEPAGGAPAGSRRPEEEPAPWRDRGEGCLRRPGAGGAAQEEAEPAGRRRSPLPGG